MNSEEKQTVEEEVKQLKGDSWYDVEEQFRKATNRKSLTRIVFVSLINPLDDVTYPSEASVEIASKLHDFFTAFIKQGNKGEDGERQLFGGVVLVTEGREKSESTAALGFLEVDSATSAYECLNALSKNNTTEMNSIRILLVSDDCPCNDFGPFAVYLARPPNEEYVDIIKEGPTFVFKNMMKNLCDQCQSFYFESGINETNNNLKELSGINRKSIPSALRIRCCATSDAFPTLEEYMYIYHSPIYFELDSETSSPLLPVVDWKQVKAMTSSLFEKN